MKVGHRHINRVLKGDLSDYRQFSHQKSAINHINWNGYLAHLSQTRFLKLMFSTFGNILHLE